MRESKGITLIALVVSIIVMLILAGISLNATVGENGIIARAQSATYSQTVAELEEFFNEYYVENYDYFKDATSKVEALKSKNVEWFYNTSDGYIVDDSGHAMYLIVKSKFLEDNPDMKMNGGDAGDGVSYKYYAGLQDVYGVTKDLKVYYCSNGSNSILGINENELDDENFSRVTIESSNALANLIPHSSEDGVTVSEARSVTSLTIDASDNIADLTELYKLSSLTSLTIKNKKGNEISLKGIENITKLNYICFYQCNLNDYSKLKNVTKLKYLYLYKSNNDELEKICNAMKDNDYNELEYLGIYGETVNLSTNYYTSNSTVHSDVSTLSYLNILSENTKKSVKKLLINNNSITSLNGIENYTNVNVLVANGNNLASLSGLEGFASITVLAIQNNSLLSDISAISSNSIKQLCAHSIAVSNISALTNMTSMSYINLQNDKNITDISPISGMMSLVKLYLAGCSNLTSVSIRTIRSAYNRVGIYSKSIDSKYISDLNSDDIKNYANNSFTDAVAADKLLNDTSIIKLNLKGNSALANTPFNTLSAETQAKILERLGNTEASKTNDAYFRYILSTMTQMKYLCLNDITNLSNLDFVKYMPGIVELDLRKTGITDLSILETLVKDTGGSKIPSLGALLLDNMGTDLTKIQSVINQLYSGGSSYWNYVGDARAQGLVIGNASLLTADTTSLKACKNITQLFLMLSGPSTSTYYDLSACTNLKKYKSGYVSSVIKLPYTIENFYAWHSQFPVFDGSFTNRIKLKTFDLNNSSETTALGLKNMFESLKYVQTSEEITIRISADCNVNSLAGVSNLKNAKISSFEFNPYYINIVDINDLGLFEGGSGYIKTISLQGSLSNGNKSNIEAIPNLEFLNTTTFTINNCNIANIEGVRKNKTIQTINLDNNSIQNLSPISEMKQLKSLSLYGNKIYNNYFDSLKNEKVNNLNILYNINHNINNEYNVTYVNLRENNLESTEEYNKVKNSYGSNCYW